MPTKASSKPKRVVSENRDSSIKFYAGLFGITLVVIVGVVLLGKSDQGEIDVNAAIISANQNRPAPKEGEAPVEEVKTIPKRLRDLPNGGLVPTDTVVEEKPKPVETPTDDETSSSTPDNSEENTEGESADTEESAEEVDDAEVSSETTEVPTEETGSDPTEETSTETVTE